MTIDLKLARSRLAVRKCEIEQHSTISSEARAVVALDQQSVGRLSRMDAMQAQAMAEANERARHAELSRIEKALARVDSGEYGYCLDCGEEIADRRLQIDPSVALCVGCADGRQ